MKKAAISAIVVSFLLASPGMGMSKDDQAKLEAQIRAIDKDKIHKLVQAVEVEPLGKMAEETRPVLVVYFEPIHYTVCLDQIGFLMSAEPKVLMNVFWQVVFSSGDFFLQHPEESADRLVYMKAGLEGALRVYERILAAQPEAKNAKLDELIRLRNEGQLGDYVRANPCGKK